MLAHFSKASHKEIVFLLTFFLNSNLHQNNLHIFVRCHSDMLVCVLCWGVGLISIFILVLHLI
jgi:hypothetical protein